MEEELKKSEKLKKGTLNGMAKSSDSIASIFEQGLKTT